MDEAAARRELRRIEDGGFAAPADGDALAPALLALEALGSADPVLRDELAYDLLRRWTDAEVLTDGQMRELLRRALGGMTAGIGEAGSDSVFRRTFSLLVVALALVRDSRRAFLDEREWRETLDAVVSYCGHERDLRAHVAGKGWAHAVAHAADVLDELARSPRAAADDRRRLWDAAAALVDRADEIFRGEEDERLAVALAGILAAGDVSPAELRRLLEAKAPAEPAAPDTAAGVRRVNWKLVARSLLRRLRVDGRQDAAEALAGVDEPFAPF